MEGSGLHPCAIRDSATALAAGLPNACDNCVFDHNPRQSDLDRDSEGDVCDLNDGLIYLFTGDRNFMEWQPEAGFTAWNSFRGSLNVLRSTGVYTQVPGSNPGAARDCGLTSPCVIDEDGPAIGEPASLNEISRRR